MKIRAFAAGIIAMVLVLVKLRWWWWYKAVSAGWRLEVVIRECSDGIVAKSGC
jgi:hypothetical protein